jgi:CRISPR/Cas system-associated endoribonuclease Cas2
MPNCNIITLHMNSTFFSLLLFCLFTSGEGQKSMELNQINQWYQNSMKELVANEKDPVQLQSKIKLLAQDYETRIMKAHEKTKATTERKVPITKSETLPPIGPIKFAGFYVEPYYSGPTKEGESPLKVAVAQEYDGLLSSTKKADILSVRDKVQSNHQMLTPMTLFVLSARLYDVGEREEAVFWYYNALYRARAVSALLDKQILSSVNMANHSFMELLGPVINGYAFCDINNQMALEKKSLNWSKQNTYKVLLQKDIPSPHTDRNKALQEFETKYISHVQKSLSHLEKIENRKALIEERKQNKADIKYCW